MTVDVAVAMELAAFEGIEKTYGEGRLAVHALRGVDLRLRST